MSRYKWQKPLSRYYRMDKPKKILIIRTDRLGDVILSTPVIENLRRAFPQAYIAFMCRPYTKEVVEGNPFLDEVIIYDKENRHKSLAASIRFARGLAKKKFDWAIILHPTNRSHIVAFFAAIPLRVGWDRKMGFLLTHRLKHNKQQGFKHELEYTLDVLRKLGIPIVSKQTYFPLSDIKRQEIENLLKVHGLGQKDRLVVLHPSASCPSKRWPEESFSRLAAMLKQSFDCKIAIITAQGQEGCAAAIVEENEVIDLRGKLTISQIAALLSRAALFISNDSGPVHIAASLKVPVISIFGRNNPGLSPQRWKPLGERSYVLHKPLDCNPCLAHNCKKQFLCLQAITPEDVFKLARSILSSDF